MNKLEADYSEIAETLKETINLAVAAMNWVYPKS